jgi:hypothetical protein
MAQARGQSAELRFPLRAQLGFEAGMRSPNARVRAGWLGLAALFAIAFGLLARMPMVVRAAPAVAVAALSLASLWSARRRRGPAPVGWVTLDRRGVVRIDGGRETRLVSFDAPFGVTVLSTPMFDRTLLAFTTPEQTRYLCVAPPEEMISAGLLGHPCLVADSDAMIGIDGLEVGRLSFGDADALLGAIAKRDPRASRRLYLGDPQRAPIELDGPLLVVGRHHFDLSAPVDWRGFVFHESIGEVGTLYQATSLRQQGSEVVFVAPLPAEISTWMLDRAGRSNHYDPQAQSAVLRDLRLLQAFPDVPPSRDLRVAVERLFMVPLRQALDRAPRASRSEAATLTASGRELTHTETASRQSRP